ncbi:MAG: hypothetical protein KDK65_06580 [Chlamydiia bacterium]|nr:hypothetical protein [Chlamydiia bacterium]
MTVPVLFNSDIRLLILQQLPLPDIVKMKHVCRAWRQSASDPKAYEHLPDITATAIILRKPDLKNIRRSERVADTIYQIFMTMLNQGVHPLTYNPQTHALNIAKHFTTNQDELANFSPTYNARRDRTIAGPDLEKGVNPFQDETHRMRLIRNILLFEIAKSQLMAKKVFLDVPLAGIHSPSGITHLEHFVDRVIVQYHHYTNSFCSGEQFNQYAKHLPQQIREGNAAPIWNTYTNGEDASSLTTLYRACTDPENWQLRLQFVHDVLHRELILNPPATSPPLPSPAPAESPSLLLQGARWLYNITH